MHLVSPRRLPHPLRRLRRFLRHPPLYWSAVALVAVVTASAVWTYVARAERGAARYGRPTSVIVARRDLVPGAQITDDDVERRQLPASAVPADALDELAVGAVVTAGINEGETVTRRRLSAKQTSPLAARLGTGLRGVAIDRGQHPLPLRNGDRVDVVAADVDGARTVTFAAAAEVVDVDRQVVVVAVPANVAGSLAALGASGNAQITLLGLDP